MEKEDRDKRRGPSVHQWLSPPGRCHLSPSTFPLQHHDFPGQSPGSFSISARSAQERAPTCVAPGQQCASPRGAPSLWLTSAPLRAGCRILLPGSHWDHRNAQQRCHENARAASLKVAQVELVAAGEHSGHEDSDPD